MSPQLDVTMSILKGWPEWHTNGEANPTLTRGGSTVRLLLASVFASISVRSFAPTFRDTEHHAP